MTVNQIPSNFVYYKVRGECAKSARTAFGAMCASIQAQGYPAPRLMRRPEPDAAGLQTWMEVHPTWQGDYVSAVQRTLAESGLDKLIEGERHSEIFVDIP